MKLKKTDTYIRVLDFINGKELLCKGEKILLALSAGKDSMALLDIFLRLKIDLSIDIGIFHLNHMMRGRESDDDEIFVTDVARRNKIELFVNKFDFKNNKPNGRSFEEYAREKRYELLELIRTQNDFHKIATAHNRDDNVETILMRILTGTGIYGLRGIDCKKDKIIRPFLIFSSEEIYGYLNENQLKWREDSSNKEEKYLRNYIRNSILPAIGKRFNYAADSIISLSNIADEYTSLIYELLAENGELYIAEDNSIIIGKEKYINNKKLFKFIISKALRDNFNEFSTSGILEEIYKKAVTEKTNMLIYKNKNLTIKKTITNRKKVIVISGNIDYDKNIEKINEWEYKIDLNYDGNNSIFIREINRKLSINFVDYYYFLEKKDSKHIIFISDIDYKNVIIRNWRNGDRIKLNYGLKKLKELMIDNKYDNELKYSIPLFIVNSQIAAFMCGFVSDDNNRVSVDFYVHSGSKKILAIHTDKYQL